MPNYCNYSMKVVGNKENIEEFIKVLQCNYNYRTNEFTFKRHFWRVFEAEPESIEERSDGKYETYVNGYCAWSVFSCMMDGDGTYQNDKKKEIIDSDEVIINHGTTLQAESENLGLDIEIYSTEPGIEFAEHYLYKHGEEIINEETKYSELYFDSEDEMKEYNKKQGTDYKRDEYDGYIVIGGYQGSFDGEYVYNI